MKRKLTKTIPMWLLEEWTYLMRIGRDNYWAKLSTGTRLPILIFTKTTGQDRPPIDAEWFVNLDALINEEP